METDLDNKVKAWMEGLGWQPGRIDDLYFYKPSDFSEDNENRLWCDAAKQLYLNPPLDSPAVRRAVLEAQRLLFEKMRLYERPEDYVNFTKNLMFDLGDGVLRTWVNAYYEIKQQLKELEEEDEKD